MSNTSNVASRVLARRQQLRQQETARESTGYGNSTAISSPQYYLLFFSDNEERLILPENNIKKFIDDKAIVMIDRKRKIATIEAQGQYKDDHSLDLFREKDEIFESTVIYGNEDLLRIRAKDYGDYGRLLLRKLYSKKELAERILPPGHQRYTRPPLDNDRFEYLHRAMATKFRLSSLHYGQFYTKLLRPKLADFLIDERKRQNKEAQMMMITDSNDNSIS
ncbi:unnamed protein product [Rotaria sp. Silwood2]|nr:unnamed protein product [Rotaria sp. Silwood2]